MSATLTPKRKSARDRPGVKHKMGGIGGEKAGNIVALTEVLVVVRRALLISTHTPRGSAVFSSHACSARSAPPSCVLPLPLTHRAHFALLLGFFFLMPPSAAPLRALHRDVLVVLHSLVHIVALGLVHHPRRPLLAAVDALAALDAAVAPPVCPCHGRARMREIGGAWRAPQKTPSTTLAAAAPAALVAWPKTIDGPLSGPKCQNSSEKGRALDGRRAAPAVARPYRRLGPSEQPSHRPPIAPVVGLDRFCIAVL